MDEARALIARGDAAIATASWDEARFAFEQAVELLEGTTFPIALLRAWKGIRRVAEQTSGAHARALFAAERALECARRSKKSYWIVDTLFAFGSHCRDASRFDDAIRACNEACALIDAEQEPLVLAQFVFLEGKALEDSGRDVEALVQFERALEVSERSGDNDLAHDCKQRIAEIAEALGDRARAHALFTDTLEYWSARDQPWGQANALHGLATLARYRGDLRAARELEESAVPLHRRAGNRSGEASSLRHLGEIAMDRSDYNTAMTLLRDALAIDRSLGDRHSVASGLVALGHCSLNAKRFDDAYATLSEARVEAITASETNSEGNAAFLLASVLLQRGQLDEARVLCDEARVAFERAERRHGLANVESKLGDIARARDDFDVARAHYERAIERFEALGHEYSVGSTYERLSFIARTDGERTELLQQARAAFVRAKRPDLARDMARALQE